MMLSPLTIIKHLILWAGGIFFLIPLIAQTPSTPSTDSTEVPYKSAVKAKVDSLQDTVLYKITDYWLDTPYEYGGTDTSGTDCSNLARQLYQQCYEISLPRQSSAIYQQCQPIKKTHLQTGDLVFFKINNNSISHVGVYLANGKFVHASKQAGVVISDLSLSYYQKHFYKGGRIKRH